jgi:hypothetical protein
MAVDDDRAIPPLPELPTLLIDSNQVLVVLLNL